MSRDKSDSASPGAMPESIESKANWALEDRAWNEFVECLSYDRGLIKYANALWWDAHIKDSPDLAHEVLVAALGRICEVRESVGRQFPHGNIDAQVLAFVRSYIKKCHYESWRFHKSRRVTTTDTFDNIATRSDDDPTMRAAKNDVAEKVKERLELVEPLLQSIVLLRTVNDCSWDTIASTLSITSSMAKSAYHRHLDELRHRFAGLMD